MIVVKVEANGREVAKMFIENDGTGTVNRGNYKVSVFKKGTKEAVTMREGHVLYYPRKSSHTWRLVALALEAVGYFK